MTQKELSDRLEGRVAQSTISEWTTGKSEPALPAVTFEVELAVGADPGTLSGHLGYIPVSAAGTLESHLLGSGEIDENWREVLLTLVREINRQRHG